MSSIESDGARAAERAYEEFAAQSETRRDFDAFCAARPELAQELRHLHALGQRITGASPSGSRAGRLAEHGSEADPHATLADVDERPTSAGGFLSDVLGRLGERKGAFGRYVLKDEIDRGGQGAVVRVWDEDLRRVLAMKVLLGKGTPPASGTVEQRSLGRFLEEAQVTAQLDHPGIVPVHELGLDAEGRVYFTMRLVKGRTLKEVLGFVAEGKEGWTQTRALGVFSRVCEAMAYAHHKGVVHRDLKPANVMVGRFGEVYVMDWGLAMVLGREDMKDVTIAPQVKTVTLSSERRERGESASDSPLLTMDGDVVGTPGYMSPEQALGRTKAIGPHSDVYAVGAMLYHLFAGHMPYVEPGMRLSNYDIWYMVQKGPPAPLAEHAAATPAELVAICERAMAREIEGRYPDMQALAADLAAFLEHRVVAAYETGALAEARKWVVRNKPLAASLAAAVVLLVGGLVASLVFKARADGNAELATRRANDVLSLSASKDLEDLVARADTLWPAHPDLLDDYEHWLADARELLEGRPADPARGLKERPSLDAHKAKLAELRAGALPRSAEAALAERESQAGFAVLAQRSAELGWRSRMLSLEPWPSEAEVEAELAQQPLPEDAHGLNTLAWVLVEPKRAVYGQEVKGLVLARRALAEASDVERPAIRDTLAWAYLAVGRLDDALAAEARAVDEAGPEKAKESEAYSAVLVRAVERWTSAEARALRRQERDALVGEVEALDRALDERQTWEFEDPEGGWWHVQLSELVSNLEALRDPRTGLMGDTLSGSFGWGVARRHEFARTIGESSVDGSQAQRRWAEAIASIAVSTDYGSLALAPQMGLMPLGPDPRSGLWEFAHLQTGAPAERGADGQLVLTEATGLVFVLIPGGSFWMGAQSDPSAANYDPRARDDEGPVHEVTLSPFFLSKYEMTQGQWQRFSGRNPSNYGPLTYLAEWDRRGMGWSGLHPVEQVSRLTCMEVCERLGLALPSEAQWEYGARAGSSTAYCCGDDPASLEQAANVTDVYAKGHGGGPFGQWEAWDDGHTVHAEVGTYDANAFGLHDVHGNVFEWCLDGFDASYYGRSSRADPVSDPAKCSYGVSRGGCFSFSAVNARVALRNSYSPEFAGGIIGLRPAMTIRLQD